MHSRIKQLAEQTGMLRRNNEYCFEEIDLQQFAELLIRECAQVADCRSSFKHNSGSKILRHFEVKELI